MRQRVTRLIPAQRVAAATSTSAPWESLPRQPGSAYRVARRAAAAVRCPLVSSVPHSSTKARANVGQPNADEDSRRSGTIWRRIAPCPLSITATVQFMNRLCGPMLLAAIALVGGGILAFERISASPIVATIAVGQMPVALGVDARTGHIFVANKYSASVSILDGMHGKLIRTVSVGPSPQAIAVDAQVGHVFVAGSTSTSMLDAASTLTCDT